MISRYIHNNGYICNKVGRYADMTYKRIVLPNNKIKVGTWITTIEVHKDHVMTKRRVVTKLCEEFCETKILRARKRQR